MGEVNEYTLSRLWFESNWQGWKRSGARWPSSRTFPLQYPSTVISLWCRGWWRTSASNGYIGWGGSQRFYTLLKQVFTPASALLAATEEQAAATCSSEGASRNKRRLPGWKQLPARYLVDSVLEVKVKLLSDLHQVTWQMQLLVTVSISWSDGQCHLLAQLLGVIFLQQGNGHIEILHDRIRHSKPIWTTKFRPTRWNERVLFLQLHHFDFVLSSW